MGNFLEGLTPKGLVCYCLELLQCKFSIFFINHHPPSGLCSTNRQVTLLSRRKGDMRKPRDNYLIDSQLSVTLSLSTVGDCARETMGASLLVRFFTPTETET